VTPTTSRYYGLSLDEHVNNNCGLPTCPKITAQNLHDLCSYSALCGGKEGEGDGEVECEGDNEVR